MSKLVQLITFDGEFTHDIDAWMISEGLRDRGFNYSVVTVLGCQSSGKSTLLNELFGTQFEVMDSTQGRSQTTKGLWLARDKTDPTIIIDVEGTDSRERGEDRLTFEHRASLFSLALADLVMVNMWYHDLGRYTASNYGLLKTVLAVNLELFQQQKDSPKTVMLFVIRDYSEALSPLETLEKMIQGDIRSIWKSIPKPENLQNSTADDFFEFATVGLPSKYADPALFKQKCKDLRGAWEQKYCPKRYSRQVPADGFGFYSRSVWETILRSSELDIPSQKEMLATFRCEEIKNAALAEVIPVVSAKVKEAQQGALSSSDMTWAIEPVVQAIEAYDGPAKRYQASVFQKKRQQLLESVQAELQKVVDAHLTHVRHRVSADASTGLELMFCSNGDDEDQIAGKNRFTVWADFSKSTQAWRDAATQRFETLASSIRLTYPDSSEKGTEVMTFSAAHATQGLNESLDALLLRMRERQMNEFERRLVSFCAEKLGDIEAYLAEVDLSNESFWKEMNETAQAAKRAVKEKLWEPWAGLQTSQSLSEENWDSLAGAEVARQLRLKLERICQWLPSYIFSRFQRFFDYDQDEVPKQWQTIHPDKIREHYLKAKQQALVILEVTNEVNLDVEKLTGPKLLGLAKQVRTPLLTESQRQAIMAKASRQMQKACQEAQLIQATGGRGVSIPYWIWGLILVLGWNELSMIIFSPFALISVVIAIVVGAISYTTGNFKLPVRLSRQIVGMMATTLMPVLASLQQGPALPPPPSATPSTKRESAVKEE